MTAKPSSLACDGGGRATERACKLAMPGAGIEARGDRNEQLGPLQVIRSSEGRLAETRAAGEAAKTGPRTIIGLAGVRTCVGIPEVPR